MPNTLYYLFYFIKPKGLFIKYVIYLQISVNNNIHVKYFIKSSNHFYKILHSFKSHFMEYLSFNSIYRINYIPFTIL